jgi:hypothetical protein
LGVQALPVRSEVPAPVLSCTLSLSRTTGASAMASALLLMSNSASTPLLVLKRPKQASCRFLAPSADEL